MTTEHLTKESSRAYFMRKEIQKTVSYFTVEKLEKCMDSLKKPYIPIKEARVLCEREIKDIQNVQRRLDRDWALASRMK